MATKYRTDSYPYKVYTALLTQSGGDDPLSIQSGILTVGVTYLLDDNSGYPDFTNVGAPNNNSGTYFVATGTIPNSWGQATLLYNSGAPVVTVLENTIGDIWFTYQVDGFYFIESNSLFIENKTLFQTNTYFESNDGTIVYCISNVRSNTTSKIEIFSFSKANDMPIDNMLYNTPIEIRVYN